VAIPVPAENGGVVTMFALVQEGDPIAVVE
jgi:hypothetical protein